MYFKEITLIAAIAVAGLAGAAPITPNPDPFNSLSALAFLAPAASATVYGASDPSRTGAAMNTVLLPK